MHAIIRQTSKLHSTWEVQRRLDLQNRKPRDCVETPLSWSCCRQRTLSVRSRGLNIVSSSPHPQRPLTTPASCSKPRPRNVTELRLPYCVRSKLLPHGILRVLPRGLRSPQYKFTKRHQSQGGYMTIRRGGYPTRRFLPVSDRSSLASRLSGSGSRPCQISKYDSDKGYVPVYHHSKPPIGSCPVWPRGMAGSRPSHVQLDFQFPCHHLGPRREFGILHRPDTDGGH